MKHCRCCCHHRAAPVNLVSVAVLFACVVAIGLVFAGVIRNGSHPLWVLPPLAVACWAIATLRRSATHQPAFHDDDTSDTPSRRRPTMLIPISEAAWAEVERRDRGGHTATPAMRALLSATRQTCSANPALTRAHQDLVPISPLPTTETSEQPR